MVSAASPYFIMSVPAASASGPNVWNLLLIYLILFGGVGCWLWYRKVAESKPLEEGDLEGRMSQPFSPGGVFYPENKKSHRPYVRHYWMGLGIAAVFLLTSRFLPEILAWLLVLAGLGLSAWMFFYREPPHGRLPVWANLQPDHLVVTALDGTRDVFVLGPRVNVVLEVERAPMYLFGDPPPNLHRYFMRITEGATAARIPLEFAGSGEYLAICREAGVGLSFAPGTPAWFEKELRQLPSWRPGYFKAPAKSRGETRALVCRSCGGAGSYGLGGGSQLCHFCGSAELQPSHRS